MTTPPTLAEAERELIELCKGEYKFDAFKAIKQLIRAAKYEQSVEDEKLIRKDAILEKNVTFWGLRDKLAETLTKEREKI